MKFVQDIMQYCIAEGANAEGDSVAACMKNWGYDLPADATEADAFNAILAKYDTLTEAVDTEKANATFTSLLNDYETKYTKVSRPAPPLPTSPASRRPATTA